MVQCPNFGRRERTVDFAEIRKTAEELSQKLGVPINVHESLEMVPEGKAREALEEGKVVTEATIPYSAYETNPRAVVDAIAMGIQDVLNDKPFTLDESIGKVEPKGGESTTRFRVVAPGISTSEMGMAQALYEARVATRGYQVKEALQDSMLGLRACYDAIEKSLGRKREVWEISDDENAYTFENRMSSMNAVQQKEYEERFIKPLLKEVDKLTRGRNKGDRATMYADLVSYMMAKHGLGGLRVYLNN